MIEIRRYESGEEADIVDLINDIMTREYGTDAAAYPTGDIEDISSSYGALGEAFFVAVEGNRVVGTVAIKKEDDRIALLRRLFVSPDYRGRKIGVKLLDQALEFCNQVGYSELVFRTTSKMLQAIELCKKKGFTQKAKLDLGPVELFKFSVSVKKESKQKKTKASK